MVHRDATLEERRVRDGKLPYSQTVTGTSGGSVAVNPRFQFTILEIKGASNNDFTLADGIDGQRMVVRAGSKGGSGDGLLKPDNLNGGSQITFNNADEVAELEFADGGWNVTGLSGATLS